MKTVVGQVAMDVENLNQKGAERNVARPAGRAAGCRLNLADKQRGLATVSGDFRLRHRSRWDVDRERLVIAHKMRGSDGRNREGRRHQGEVMVLGEGRRCRRIRWGRPGLSSHRDAIDRSRVRRRVESIRIGRLDGCMSKRDCAGNWCNCRGDCEAQAECDDDEARQSPATGALNANGYRSSVAGQVSFPRPNAASTTRRSTPRANGNPLAQLLG